MEKQTYEMFVALVTRLVVEELEKFQRSVPIGVSNRHPSPCHCRGAGVLRSHRLGGHGAGCRHPAQVLWGVPNSYRPERIVPQRIIFLAFPPLS
mgnify:CR=1 FL=1